MVMFLKANEALTNPHHLRDLVRRALWLLLGVEFVVNFFPLRLWAEILLVPFMTTIALLGVLPQDAKGAAGAKKFSEIVLGGFFVFLVIRFVVRVATDVDAFASSETLARFWVPPALTLVVLPFLYLLGLYMAYEQAFLRLGFVMEGEPLFGYAKRAFFRRFGLSLGELREVGGGPLQVKVARAASRQEIDAILRSARQPSRWRGRGNQDRGEGRRPMPRTRPTLRWIKAERLGHNRRHGYLGHGIRVNYRARIVSRN